MTYCLRSYLSEYHSNISTELILICVDDYLKGVKSKTLQNYKHKIHFAFVLTSLSGLFTLFLTCLEMKILYTEKFVIAHTHILYTAQSFIDHTYTSMLKLCQNAKQFLHKSQIERLLFKWNIHKRTILSEIFK